MLSATGMLFSMLLLCFLLPQSVHMPRAVGTGVLLRYSVYLSISWRRGVSGDEAVQVGKGKTVVTLLWSCSRC